MMRLRSYILPLILSVGITLTSCHSAIMSDLTDCPQYTVFAFHVQTPDEISYPDGKIDDIRVFAFDEAGKLIGEWTDGGVAFLPGYELKTDYYRPGTTAFVAWAGKDLSQYDFSAFTAGASKEELLVFMAKQEAKIAATAGPLYVGEPDGGALTQEERSTLGTFTDSLDFALTQITNRINLQVQGLEPGHQYTIRFTAKNSKYGYDGTMLPDTPFEWTTDTFTQTEKDGNVILSATYDILRLVANAAYGDYLIEVLDETGNAVYDFDPLRDYILHPLVEDEFHFSQRLDLNHEYSIVIDLRKRETPAPDGETYMAVQAWIQNWNLVFRDVKL